LEGFEGWVQVSFGRGWGEPDKGDALVEGDERAVDADAAGITHLNVAHGRQSRLRERVSGTGISSNSDVLVPLVPFEFGEMRVGLGGDYLRTPMP
jgi:hypothetical protein